jgi:hypothetical protein
VTIVSFTTFELSLPVAAVDGVDDVLALVDGVLGAVESAVCTGVVGVVVATVVVVEVVAPDFVPGRSHAATASAARTAAVRIGIDFMNISFLVRLVWTLQREIRCAGRGAGRAPKELRLR